MRVVSAFLFSLVLLAISCVGFWFFMMQSFETRLKDSLTSAFGGAVKYSHIRWELEPTKIHQTIRNMQLTVPVSEAYELTFDVGNARIEANFFEDYKLNITLPKSINIHVKQNGKELTVLTSYIENGDLSYYQDGDRHHELALNFMTFILKTKHEESLVRASDGFINMTRNSRDHTTVLFNKPHIMGVNTALDSLFFDIDQSTVRQLIPLMFAVVQNPTTLTYSKAVNALLTESVANRNLFSIYDARLSWADKAIGFKGAVRVLPSLKPYGEVTLSASTGADFKRTLAQSRVLQNVNLSHSRAVQSMLRDHIEDTYTGTLGFTEDGMFTLNEIAIGESSAIPHILRIQ